MCEFSCDGNVEGEWQGDDEDDYTFRCLVDRRRAGVRSPSKMRRIGRNLVKGESFFLEREGGGG